MVITHTRAHTRTCAALRSAWGYSAERALTPDSEEEDTEGRGDGTEGGRGGVWGKKK